MGQKATIGPVRHWPAPLPEADFGEPICNIERPEETALGGMDAAQHDYESHFAIAVLAASIFAFTESRLKLAPFCIGGNSTAVMASFSTSC
ncbi:hypothetical protein AB7M47_002876 [Bradyrhizobium elkanii]